jgi:VanZ family protein
MPARAGFTAPFFTGVLYAVSDEIHQLFVPGRAGQIRDVLIDACGVFVGIIIANRLLRRSAEGGQNPDTGAHN